MSQGGDKFRSHFEEGSQIPDYVDSQTNPKFLQESSIFSSRRKLNEHYQSHHHNNQLPADQFVMNRPDVDPTLRHVFVDATTNGLNYVREVVEQEHRQSRKDYPRVIRRTPCKPNNPRYAAIGLPVDPNLHAFKKYPHHSMPKATNDESSTPNNIRTDCACSRVPRLHQSSSHSGREVFEQEHRQSKIDRPRVIRPTPYTLYDPRYAAIGLPEDPLLRAFRQYPNFRVAKRDE